MKNDETIRYIEEQSRKLSDRELLEKIYIESQPFFWRREMLKMMRWTMIFAGCSFVILLIEFPPLWLR